MSGLLRKGRAIILIDGMDEIREAHRPDVISWLELLTQYYPEAFYVATSRPAAVREQWRNKLRTLGFVTAQLEPMTRTQVDDFIDRWYRAATGSESRAMEFKLRLASRPDLQILATTPLLCAVMCAIYLEIGHLPRKRTELYKMALRLLLERRDVQRSIRCVYRPLSV